MYIVREVISHTQVKKPVHIGMNVEIFVKNFTSGVYASGKIVHIENRDIVIYDRVKRRPYQITNGMFRSNIELELSSLVCSDNNRRIYHDGDMLLYTKVDGFSKKDEYVKIKTGMTLPVLLTEENIDTECTGFVLMCNDNFLVLSVNDIPFCFPAKKIEAVNLRARTSGRDCTIINTRVVLNEVSKDK